MTDDDRNRVWRRNEPDSPCQAICLIDPDSGLCIGCNRTSAEIAGWAGMTPEARQELRQELPNRRPEGSKRKRRRARRVAEREDSRKD